MPYLGEIAALSTALCWLGSSLAFAVAGREAGAQPLNQFRLYAALPMLCLLGFAMTGAVWPGDASWSRVSLLALSGVVGLVVGDYGYFHSLATIGPRLASVIMALWPACTVGIDALRGEAPSPEQGLGVLLTVVGVTLVLARSRGGSWRPDLSRRQWTIGVLGALVGALGQAAGFVMARAAMAPAADLPTGVDPLLATIVRMGAATVGMQLVVVLQRRPFAMRKIWQVRKALGAALVGTLCGPVVGVWMSMVAGANARDAGVAAALMGTTPVFMLPVTVWLYRARVGPLGVIGTLLAVAGVAVCFVRGGG
ncbi:MAG: DMT family transporter [Planctomycetota bacterium]